MTVAQGVKKLSVIAKQVALGTPVAGAGGQILRRVTAVAQGSRDTYASNEIVSHQQSTGVGYGLKKPSIKLSALLSPATYKLLFAAALRQDFVAGAATAAHVDITAASAGPQFTSGGAQSFLTAGLKVGDVGRWTGFTAAHNNGRNFLITALTATQMTGVFLDGSAVTAEAAGQSVTFTVTGKKTMVPLTGHTNDYFTWEEFYADLTKSDYFTDMKAGKIDVGLPATGNATFACDLMGLNRTIGNAQLLTTPTAETTTPIMVAVQGVLYVNGVATGCTGATISIDGGVQAAIPEIGSNVGSDLGRGTVKVSGNFTGLFKDSVIQGLYDTETPVSLVLVIRGDQTATSPFMVFSMGRIKITDDAPDDGEKEISRTYPYTAEINVNGGAALAWDETILTVQDSEA